MLTENLFTSKTFLLTFYESLLMYENFFYFLLPISLFFCIRAEFNMFVWNRTWHEPNQAAKSISLFFLFGLHINPPHNHSLKFYFSSFILYFSYIHIYLLYSWKFVCKAVMSIPLQNIYNILFIYILMYRLHKGLIISYVCWKIEIFWIPFIMLHMKL